MTRDEANQSDLTRTSTSYPQADKPCRSHSLCIILLFKYKLLTLCDTKLVLSHSVSDTSKHGDQMDTTIASRMVSMSLRMLLSALWR